MTTAGHGPVRQSVLLYCHHSTGLGHLVRSLSVAGALAQRSRVVVCSGGRVPTGIPVPPGVELVALPPVGTGPDGALQSLDPSLTLEEAWVLRKAQLLGCFEEADPDTLVVELFPFGRRKFSNEIIALLERARNEGRPRTVISSVRDVLVDGHPDKQRHDDEAAERLARYFDAVVVHGDPRFARLEETFRPTVAPPVPVFYSGFVAPPSAPLPTVRREDQVVVSAGGGLTGAALHSAAVEAYRSVLHRAGMTMRVIAGPFLPAEDFSRLAASAAGLDGLSVERFVPDLARVIAGSGVSVSQCGYNTSIDLLRARVPAVVVPYEGGRETEQLERARRLEALGVVSVLSAAGLSPGALARKILDAASSPRPAAVLQLDGASRTAELVESLSRGLATVAS